MLRIRSTILRTTRAFMVAATVLSADVLAAPSRHGAKGGSWGNWGGWGNWGTWCGQGGTSGGQPVNTPEINPALIGGVITLLLGGALILTDMLRNKRNHANN